MRKKKTIKRPQFWKNQTRKEHFQVTTVCITVVWKATRNNSLSWGIINIFECKIMKIKECPWSWWYTSKWADAQQLYRPGYKTGERKEQKKRKHNFKYIKLQTQMDFKRIYSPENRENKCKTISLCFYVECWDHDSKRKKPLTVLWSTNPSNIKRLYISSAAGEFIYVLEMKELRDVTTKISERKYPCVFFSLTNK